MHFVYDISLKADLVFDAVLFAEQHIASKKSFFYPKNRRFGMLLESPMNRYFCHAEKMQHRFQTVFTHRKALIEQGPPFRELPFGCCFIDHEKAFQGLFGDAGGKDRLLSFVGSVEHELVDGYAFRKDVADYLLESQSCDVFGKGLKPIQDKLEGLSRYAFSIAMENVSEDYYFTEKLIDCFLTETVPVYFGCPSLERYFDPGGFLRFSSIDELKSLLPTLTMEKYRQMRPLVARNRITAIENHLASHQGVYHRLAFELEKTIPAGKGLQARSKLLSMWRN